MKKIKILIAFLAIMLSNSCTDYLDVAPDEIATEAEAFANPRAAERFLYSCYSYIPNPRLGASSLDWFTGDEVVTAFEHEIFAKFPQGNFTANNPVISYWDTLFGGIKQCYRLINNINSVPQLDEDTKKDYIAQANFLIGYYHFLLLRSYGPIILVKEEPSILTPPQDYLGRRPFDECVDFIAAKFDEAAVNLPTDRTDIRKGLATNVAASAIKGRLLLYAASPLFNGNSKFYSNFENKDGEKLMNLNYSIQKWELARDANLKAIQEAEAAGIRLYISDDSRNFPNLPEPADQTQRALRFNAVDKNSKEAIWIDARAEGRYSLQNKSRPFWTGRTWNGIAPTLAMLDRFYTENGLPIDQDPNFEFNNRFDVVTFPTGDINGEGETSLMNLRREPRYYAWIDFHGGYYEAQGQTTQANEKWAYLPEYKRGIDNKKIVTFFTSNDNAGRHGRTNNYSPSGFLSKKGVHPGNTASESGSGHIEYPWAVVRLGELYLNYAEACVETNNLDQAKIYINKIRERAGIPTLEQAWGSIGVALTQDKLREIVRQERMIELYLEHQNFWDMRRWLLAGDLFNKVPEGMNVDGTTISSFSRKTKLTGIIRNFTTPTHYLLPIPFGEVQKNPNLVQNPGY